MQTKSTVDVKLIQQMGGDHMIVAAAKVATTGSEAFSYVNTNPAQEAADLPGIHRERKSGPMSDEIQTTDIKNHEGKKYLRTIHSAVANSDGNHDSIEIDVYCVIEAFDRACPAVQHALKKLLCTGLRGKGDGLADLIGARAAIDRAIELQMIRNLS